MKKILDHIQSELVRKIEKVHSDISKNIIIPSELENHFSSLHVWLDVRNVFKEKSEEYCDKNNIKLVIG